MRTAKELNLEQMEAVNGGVIIIDDEYVTIKDDATNVVIDKFPYIKDDQACWSKMIDYAGNSAVNGDLVDNTTEQTLGTLYKGIIETLNSI